MVMNIWSTPSKLSEVEQAVIINKLSELQKSGYGHQGRHFFLISLPNRPTLFVKHSVDGDAFTEASTQTFFHARSKADGSTPRVAQVLDVFNTDEGDYFLVMENVEGKTLDSPEIPLNQAVEYAATAVQWLQAQLPSVPDTLFGRISSYPKEIPVWHPFFKDHRAGRVFTDASDLAASIAQVSKCCRQKQDRLSADEVLKLFGKPRQICHGDITLENFLVDADGVVWIVDFQHISVLPEVFQSYACFNNGGSFAAQVGKRLNQKPASEADSLVVISGVVQATFGGPL
ncbi:hypothetical protein CYLTODRAFT_438417 [Cylindrobasidium torrendii FP15055 ss-10]|uniref:Aminoglycoside phosphotransferase domain-containing protein n=1 Tax=Cylindrobasidium torrendii FP15055 ss-10 TaxID=1314674 RepID=A0A0D7B0Z4_9AGAR|nr:hypothetical protein CYLTODRAFT_438417 [Cylindrobasidium torrendii FP15055 ss-10]